MPSFINHNGRIISSSEACLYANNRSFRYGDGCFESMRISRGKIVHASLHAHRLFATLDALAFSVPAEFTPSFLIASIEALARKNDLAEARVRLTIYRGNGGLYDVDENHPQYIIQVYPVSPINQDFPAKSFSLGICRDVIKCADSFSFYKTNNFFCYAAAARWAQKHDFDDAILLNQYNQVAETTIANLFVVQDGVIKTPAATEGCIGGVMRKFLLTEMKAEGLPVMETTLTEDDLANSSEVFLTNAVRGIIRVKQIGSTSYSSALAERLFRQHILPLYNRH